MIISRRNMLLGLIAAPAIVRASSLMPVKAWREELLLYDGIGYWQYDYDGLSHLIRLNKEMVSAMQSRGLILPA